MFIKFPPANLYSTLRQSPWLTEKGPCYIDARVTRIVADKLQGETFENQTLSNEISVILKDEVEEKFIPAYKDLLLRAISRRVLKYEGRFALERFTEHAEEKSPRQ